MSPYYSPVILYGMQNPKSAMKNRNFRDFDGGYQEYPDRPAVTGGIAFAPQNPVVARTARHRSSINFERGSHPCMLMQ